jgi:hypothetical protein
VCVCVCVYWPDNSSQLKQKHAAKYYSPCIYKISCVRITCHFIPLTRARARTHTHTHTHNVYTIFQNTISTFFLLETSLNLEGTTGWSLQSIQAHRQTNEIWRQGNESLSTCRTRSSRVSQMPFRTVESVRRWAELATSDTSSHLVLDMRGASALSYAYSTLPVLLSLDFSSLNKNSPTFNAS